MNKGIGIDIKRALVTGGAGFIGSHLVRRLLEHNVPVRVLDNLSTGRLDNLKAITPSRARLSNSLEFVEGDVRNAIACQNACKNVDVVFHLAALVSVPQSVADPIQSEAINSGGTLNMLIAARNGGVRRFVFSSSAAVYGDTNVIPTHEQVLPAPLSPYGIQKLMGEHYARLFAHLHGLETVCLRYFNVYGPGQSPDSAYAAAIPKFLLALSKGEAPTIFGDGEQTRDFCAVDDVVSANLLGGSITEPAALNEVYNIAGGNRISVNALLAQMQAITGKSVAIVHALARTGDIQHSGADITKACKYLGYRPSIDLQTGLAATYKYFTE